MIEITRIDLVEGTISGKDRSKRIWTFHYAPETKVHRMTPQESIRRLDEIVRNAPFPVEVDQEVLVTWKTDLVKAGRKLAVEASRFIESCMEGIQETTACPMVAGLEAHDRLGDRLVRL